MQNFEKTKHKGEEQPALSDQCRQGNSISVSWYNISHTLWGHLIGIALLLALV